MNFFKRYKDWSQNLQYFPQMRKVGKLTSQCLKELYTIIKPGISTADIEEFVREFQGIHGLVNSQHGYQGFPGYACIGKNDVVCHGIPSKKVILNEGDIVKVDVTFNLEGFHGDAARTYPVGKIDVETHKLIQTSITAMELGLTYSHPGCMLSDIGAAIESYVISQKMKIVDKFTGHGILKGMHEPPMIKHFWDPTDGEDIEIVPGMIYTIEPIICARNPRFGILEDGWTTITYDHSWCAQEEVTVGITENGQEIFTPR